MAKLVEYICDDCGKKEEEILKDTEISPEALEVKCSCGGTFSQGPNWKDNCQVWMWNDKGGS